MPDTHDSIEDIDKSFQRGWEINRGPEQTKFFTRIIASEMTRLVDDKPIQKIVDVGCATGDGVRLLDEYFPDSRKYGVDVSEVAIRKAIEIDKVRNARPDRFQCKSMRDLCLLHIPFDVVISSNVLEHFLNPVEQFLYLASITKSWLFILTPYNEIDRIPGHRATITEQTFPEYALGWSNGSVLQRSQVIVTPTHDSGFWAGDQILQIYQRLI